MTKELIPENILAHHSNLVALDHRKICQEFPLNEINGYANWQNATLSKFF